MHPGAKTSGPIGDRESVQRGSRINAYGSHYTAAAAPVDDADTLSRPLNHHGAFHADVFIVGAGGNLHCVS